MFRKLFFIFYLSIPFKFLALILTSCSRPALVVGDKPSGGRKKKKRLCFFPLSLSCSLALSASVVLFSGFYVACLPVALLRFCACVFASSLTPIVAAAAEWEAVHLMFAFNVFIFMEMEFRDSLREETVSTPRFVLCLEFAFVVSSAVVLTVRV